MSNNMVTLDNVYKLEEKEFVVSDWGCSAVQENIRVRDKVFTKHYPPFYRC